MRNHQSVGQDQNLKEKRRKDRWKWKGEKQRNWRQVQNDLKRQRELLNT